MSNHRGEVQAGCLDGIVDRFVLGGPIDMQPLEPWAIGVERIAILLNLDGDLDLQHLSQFHVALQIAELTGDFPFARFQTQYESHFFGLKNQGKVRISLHFG